MGRWSPNICRLVSMFGCIVDICGGSVTALHMPVTRSTLGAPKWSKRVIFDAPRRPSISRHNFRKNGPFSSSNMSGAGTSTWEGVPRPKHITFDAPNWRAIGHKFGVRAVSHVVVSCSDILALDFQKMIKNVSFHASRGGFSKNVQNKLL